MNDISFLEILESNKLLSKKKFDKSLSIEIFSNITLNNIEEVLEYFLKTNNINPSFYIGDYNSILKDSYERKMNADSVSIVFLELANLVEDFHYKINLMDDKSLENLYEHTCQNIDTIFNNLKRKKIVLFNKFSSNLFSKAVLESNKLDFFCNKLNNYVRINKGANIKLINIEKIVSEIGFAKSYNLRHFHVSRSLYSSNFIINYVKNIIPCFMSLVGMSKKVLILDCDNTLWKGILGEDGLDGVKMTSSDGGHYFEQVQYMITSLVKKGVLICLCSKNNLNDVDEIFEKRMKILTSDHIILKKVNWNNKSNNILELSKELNLGLDSFVFVDDSKFETNLIKEYLPDVKTYLVPENIALYPSMIQDVIQDFYNPYQSEEDGNRNAMYQTEKKRLDNVKSFKTIDDYIDNLELKVIIHKNYKSHKERLIQLCQKTNQFNLTTKRYTVSDFDNFFSKQKEYLFFPFSVNDKFGEYGVTGFAMVIINGSNAFLDTWIMSCRVMGRNIEWSFMEFICNILESRGVDFIECIYSKTKKNKPVINFFNNSNFEFFKKKSNRIDLYYRIKIKNFKNLKNNKIKIDYE